MAKQPTVEEMQATILAQQEKLSAILIRMNEPPAPAANAFESAREMASMDGVIERQHRDGFTDAGPIKRNVRVPCYHPNGTLFTAIVEMPSRAFPRGRIVNVEDMDFSHCALPDFATHGQSQAIPVIKDNPEASRQFKAADFIHATYRVPLMHELNIGKAPLQWYHQLKHRAKVEELKAKHEEEMAAEMRALEAAATSQAAE